MLDEIQAAITAGRYSIGPHAGLRQLERGISPADIEIAVGDDEPEIIEDYPDDPRGHSCLIRGEVGGLVMHVVCKPTDPVFIISCYHPAPDIWYPDFKERRS